jgi:Derlin-2/3
MGGPAAAAVGVVGLVVGHGWWWGIYGGAGGRGSLERWGRAPAWVKNFVSDGPPNVAGTGGTGDAGRGPGPIGGVHVITPRSRTAGSSSSATATGYQWGSGQRLGES